MTDKLKALKMAAVAEKDAGKDAGNGEQVLEDGVFRLQNFLPYEFSLVANRVSSMLSRMYAERFNLSVNAWRVLAVLNNEAPLSAKQVAERIAMSAVNVSRAVAQLDKLGMVKRGANSADYRQVMLTPSKKGQTAYREVVPLAMAIENELLQGMKKGEIEGLRKTMIALARCAAERLPEHRDWREVSMPKRGRPAAGQG